MCWKNVLQLQSVFGANHRCLVMAAIFGMWEVWLRQQKRIAWAATPTWHHQDQHFVPRTAAGIGSGFRAKNWSLKHEIIIQQNFQWCIFCKYEEYDILFIFVTYIDLFALHYSSIFLNISRYWMSHDSDEMFHSFQRCEKTTLYVPFRSLAPEIDCRHGNSVGGHWRIWEVDMVLW